MSAKATYRKAPDGTTERLCGGCATFKPHTPAFYHRNASTKSGLQNNCKSCQRSDCNRITKARILAEINAQATQLLTDLWPRSKRKRIA